MAIQKIQVADKPTLDDTLQAVGTLGSRLTKLSEDKIGNKDDYYGDASVIAGTAMAKLNKVIKNTENIQTGLTGSKSPNVVKYTTTSSGEITNTSNNYGDILTSSVMNDSFYFVTGEPDDSVSKYKQELKRYDCKTNIPFSRIVLDGSKITCSCVNNNLLYLGSYYSSTINGYDKNRELISTITLPNNSCDNIFSFNSDLYICSKNNMYKYNKETSKVESLGFSVGLNDPFYNDKGKIEYNGSLYMINKDRTAVYKFDNVNKTPTKIIGVTSEKSSLNVYCLAILNNKLCFVGNGWLSIIDNDTFDVGNLFSFSAYHAGYTSFFANNRLYTIQSSTSTYSIYKLFSEINCILPSGSTLYTNAPSTYPSLEQQSDGGYKIPKTTEVQILTFNPDDTYFTVC